jgi:hypothetical protein
MHRMPECLTLCLHVPACVCWIACLLPQEEEALLLGWHVFSALDTLHSPPLSHAHDVTRHNVLYRRDSNGLRFMLCDFSGVLPISAQGDSLWDLKPLGWIEMPPEDPAETPTAPRYFDMW